MKARWQCASGLFICGMDTKCKAAYRKTLYHFLINIKNPGMPSDASAIATGRYAAPVAYALHNFALASANDFVGFDETAFWRMMDGWNALFPELGFSDFRKMFEQDLTEG